MKYISIKNAAVTLKLNLSTVRAAEKKGLFVVDGVDTVNGSLPLPLIQQIGRELNAEDRLTGAQVMAKLGVSRLVYHQYLRRGNLKPVPVPVFTYHWRYYRFALEDVNKLLEERQARYNNSSDRFKFTDKLSPPPKKQKPKRKTKTKETKTAKTKRGPRSKTK